ncbi:MAG: hypothetical protein ABSF92_14245 [Candidatus Acidiferrales bacterium]|jgi:hypothetical protein
MTRGKLTLEEQLKGVRAAIRSKRTPPQLLEGLMRRKETLEKTLRETGRHGKTKRRPPLKRLLIL